MARIMKHARPSAVLRPWDESWQVWKKGKKRGTWGLVQSGPLTEAKPQARVLSAIPARMVVAVCFWVDAIETEVVREAALLEVEMKGLASADRLIRDVSISFPVREENRTLVLAKIFPVDWREGRDGVKADHYEPSPVLAALSDQSLHLWREGDDLVAVVVWRGQVVCWETMDWTIDVREIAVWLRCFTLQVQNELKIDEPLFLKQWVRVFHELPEGFSQNSTLTERDREEGPQLVLPPTGVGWVPPPLRQAQKSAGQRQLVFQIALGVCALMLILTAVATMMQWGLNRKIEKIDRELSVIEQEAAPLRTAARRWSQIEAAVDQRFHPVEMLHLVTSAMPASGVRLTVFEMSPDKVYVEGEADNVSAATEFIKNVQASGLAEDLDWEMPPPSLQPNNTARFVINGVRHGYDAK